MAGFSDEFLTNENPCLSAISTISAALGGRMQSADATPMAGLRSDACRPLRP
jgi:hypothetical protein